MKPYVIGVDPSGSYNEGRGTTGLVVLNSDGELEEHLVVEAAFAWGQIEYWYQVVEAINELAIKYAEFGVVLSVEDYVLYATSAKAQINSEMETSKLIGAITYWAFTQDLTIFLRNASQVMNRWSNDILEYKGLIVKKGNRWADKNGEYINRHSMDALRHAVHCHYFNLKEV